MSWIVYSEEAAKGAGATESDEILYAISVSDLKGVYDGGHGEGAWDALEESDRLVLISNARSYMESFGDGIYSYADALGDAIRDWEGSASEAGELNMVPGDVAARDTF